MLFRSKIGVLVDYEGPEELGKDIAMHVAFARPNYMAKSEVPADVVSREREIALARAKESGKPPEIAAKIPHPCASLDEALDAIDKDREFLTRGGVFSNDMIDGYIALKMEEVTRFRMTTHPIEFDMYYAL